MTGFVLPSGRGAALIGDDVRLSYDDVTSVKARLQMQMAERFSSPPKRIVGCLDDTLGSLLALLACPEVTDYMPLNPKLMDRDILDLAKSGGADAAIVSNEKLQTIGPALAGRGLEVLSWDDVFAQALAASGLNTSRKSSFWQAGDGRLILHTSGTTGTPKRVPITLASMMQSAHNIAKAHALGPDDLALNALPTFHIGAIVDVLLAPFYAGGAVALTGDRSAHGLAQAIQNLRPTWVQLVPTIIRHLTDTLDEGELRSIGASLRFIRCISAPVPDDVRDRTEHLLGCPIIEMYGMTETAGQITTNGRDAPNRKRGTVGRVAAVPVKILDATGSEVAAGASGEICVSGPTVFEGYEGVGRDSMFHGTWFRTGDLGALDQDGFLTIRGRIKEMINIGGEKVAPSEIEKVALTHPDVIDAAAYAVPHETLGEVSGLTVSVRKPIDADALQDHLSRNLPNFKLPRRVIQVDELPKLPNAKVDRFKIARDAVLDASSSGPSDAAVHHREGSFEGTVAKLWSRILKSRPPQGADDFFDMGGDSLSAVQFLMDLSKALGREISPNQLFATPTFDGIVSAVSDNEANARPPLPQSLRFVSEKMSGWPGQVVLDNGLFRGIGTVKNGNPLFWSCQNTEELSLVQSSFAARRPLYIVGSLYGMGGKSIFRRNKRSQVDFEVLSDALADEIDHIQPTGEVNLGGFCGGGMVMEPVAQRLIERGRTVRVFISIDYWPTKSINAPVIHIMTQCKRNSARHTLRHMDIPLKALHPRGVRVHKIEAPHVFSFDDFPAESAEISDALDGVGLPQVDGVPDGTWPYNDRARPPKIKVLSKAIPRFFKPGTPLGFSVSIQNCSDRRLEAFSDSGLCFEGKTFNFDGIVRDRTSVFAPLAQALAPGEVATLEGEIRTPPKRVPLIVRASFKSHGIDLSKSSDRTRFFKIIFPV